MAGWTIFIFFLMFGIAIAVLHILFTIAKQIDRLINEIKKNGDIQYKTNETLTSIRRIMEKVRTGEWPSD